MKTTVNVAAALDTAHPTHHFSFGNLFASLALIAIKEYGMQDAAGNKSVLTTPQNIADVGVGIVNAIQSAQTAS